ncbi:MAG: hypothetical protein WC141_09370 [Arcobacteraceae bacterium]
MLTKAIITVITTAILGYGGINKSEKVDLGSKITIGLYSMNK